MSCFNLRLPPPKKAWQNFTLKLQTKFLLPNSKSFKKKPKFKSKKHSRTRVSFLPFKRRRTSRFFLSQKTAPVYIDKLFREPVANELVERPFPLAKTVKVLADKQVQKTAPIYIDKLFREPFADELVERPFPRSKTVKVLADKQVSVEDERGKGKNVAEADDMWESLGFGSPQMRGIDQRAEQFIASFRAEMKVEEKIAREFTVEKGSSSQQ